MQDFIYHNPTKLYFGREAESHIAEEMLALAGQAGRVLVIYGSGSVKRSGLLDQVTSDLKAKGLVLSEVGGVQPNPTLTFVKEVLHTQEKPDAILALGGGSVIDTAKTLAAAYLYEGDPWDFFTGKATLKAVLPVASVLTIPAAGSEQSMRAVITHEDQKRGMGTALLRPKVAFINPERFMTLPLKHRIAGVVDMMSHILERYFSPTEATQFVDAQAEAALRVIMRQGLKVSVDPNDYEAWSQLGLAGSFAHNGYYGMGRLEDWSCHAIEHELSGWNEQITHGLGLAVVTPAWMKFVSQYEPERFLSFSTYVMGVPAQESDHDTIQLGIAKFIAFLQKLGAPTSFAELGLENIPYEALAKNATANGPIGHLKVLETMEVEAILRLA